MRTSFSLLARETPRTCAVSAGEAKSLVMTALAIASSDNNGLSLIARILMSNLTAGFRRYVFSPLMPGIVLQFVTLRATARTATGLHR